MKKDRNLMSNKPSRLTTTKIQFWHNGIMLTLLSREQAIEKVNKKEAFIISEQAIGSLTNGKKTA